MNADEPNMTSAVEKSDFVTVVSVEAPKTPNKILHEQTNENEPFITVLSIGSSDKTKIDANEANPHFEKVKVYRLPGERLGFGLKFEGGTKSAECVKNLYIQSCAPESPASRVSASWGGLGEGDEIMAIGGRTVETMTRIDCVRALKDSPVVIELLIKRRPNRAAGCNATEKSDKKPQEPPPPPPIPPRKIPKRLNRAGLVVPPVDFADKDDDKGKSSPKRMTSSPRVTQKCLAMRPRRSSNDSGSIPPEAEVYLNLIAQEAEITRTEYESDDTGSSISTIVDRLSSFPATSNSSISESSVPSTPILGAKEIDKVLSPFELLEKEFATRFDHSDIKKLNGVTANTKLEEALTLQPPVNFQDAPLSYADEELVDEKNEDVVENMNDRVLSSYENVEINERQSINTIKNGDAPADEVLSGPPKPLPRNINSGVSRIPKRRAPPPPPPRAVKNEENTKETNFNKIETWLQDTVCNGDSIERDNFKSEITSSKKIEIQDDLEAITNIEDIEIKLEDDIDLKLEDEIEHLPRLIHFLPKISPLNTPINEKPNPFNENQVNEEEIKNNNALLKETIFNLNNNTCVAFNINGVTEVQQLQQPKFTEPFFISRNYYDEEQHSMNRFKSNDSDGSSGSSEDEVLIDIPEGPSEAYFTYWGGSQLPTIGEDEEEYSSLENSEKCPVVVVDNSEDTVQQTSDLTRDESNDARQSPDEKCEDDLLQEIQNTIASNHTTLNIELENIDQKVSNLNISDFDNDSKKSNSASTQDHTIIDTINLVQENGCGEVNEQSGETAFNGGKRADGLSTLSKFYSDENFDKVHEESDMLARNLVCVSLVECDNEEDEGNLADIEIDFEELDRELLEAEAEGKIDGDGAPSEVKAVANGQTQNVKADSEASSIVGAPVVTSVAAEIIADISEGVDGTMESAAQLLSKPSLANGVEHPPPSFSRLPPDGHEFPPNYKEPGGLDVAPEQNDNLKPQTLDIKLVMDQKSTAEPVFQHKSVVEPFLMQKKNAADVKPSIENETPPPLPTSVPPPSLPRMQSHNDVTVFDNKSAEKAARKLSFDSAAMKSKDEVDNAKVYPRKHSTGSMDDKLLTVSVNATTNDLVKMKNWRKDPKSSCSVRDKIAMFSNTTEPESPLFPCTPVTLSSTKRLSKTFKSSEDVFNDDVPPAISKRFSKSSLSIENAGLTTAVPNGCYTNGTANVVPIDSSPEKPIKRYCSVDVNRKINDESDGEINIYNVNAFTTSTLPRMNAEKQQVPPAVLERATSFSGSSYSPQMPNNYSNRTPLSKNNEEQRKNNLNLLIEQRRRSITKLRGLVIPEKVPENPSMAPIVDLPEIKSSNSILNKPRLLTKTPEYSSITPVRISPQLVSPPPWKSSQNNNVPKYSPAFKRKSLQLYNNTTPAEDAANGNATACNGTAESKKTPVKPPRTSLVNGNGYRKSSLTNGDSPKSLDSAIDNFEYLENKPLSPPHKNAMHIHDSRTDDDSDNDSAVSSSQSSYASRDSSSPPIPHSALCRTPSSDTTSSTTSTLTSGSHPSSCCGSSSSASCGRVLKPQSVEAINRKNILASAKCRSGRDLNGSPLIKRKFDEDSTDGNEEPPPAPRYCRVKQTTTAAYSETESTEPSSLEYTLTQQEAASDSDTEIRKWVRSEAKYVVAAAAPVAPVSTRERRSLLEDSDTGDLMDMLNNSKPAPTIAGRGKIDVLNKDKRSTSVNDIRKTFEKIAPPAPVLTNGRSKTSLSNGNSNGLTYNHQRISSLDSTTSEGSSGVSSMLANGQNNHSGSSNNLQSGDFGSISSLASSTSVISQQELQQLIDEANAASEGPCSQGSCSTMALGDALVIVLHREAPGSSVGITLAGGADYETKEITIHKVLAGSPADRDGRVQKGDRVLSINGKSMRGVTHRESLAILKAPRSEVVLVTSKSKVQSPQLTPTTKAPRKSLLQCVSSDSSTSDTNGTPTSNDKTITEIGVFTVTLQKEGASLGFSLEGGQDSPLGDKPLVIKKIFTGGAADKVDMLKAGDELLRVNDQIVSNLSRVEVWSMMKRLPNGPVEVTVRR